MENIDISVIVLQYNPSWDKLELTLQSIIRQKEIEIEVIIADDGSKDTLCADIEDYFGKNNFDKFRLVINESNGGTVKNLNSAVEVARGKYIKAIAPGDMLTDDDILSSWYKAVEESKVKVSFCDAVYFDDKKALVEVPSAPRRCEVYEGSNDYKKLFINYLLGNDTILGATLLLETGLVSKYLKYAINRIIYAEDYLVRLAIFEQEKVLHFKKIGIAYEYGTGVSTSNNDIWAIRLKRDFDESNSIIVENCEAKNRLAIRYQKYLRRYSNNACLRKLAKIIMFPQIVGARRLISKAPNKTRIDIQSRFI